MRTIVLLISTLFIIGCENSGEEKDAAAVVKPEPIIVGRVNPAMMDAGDYVLGGSAHAYNYGDVIEVENNTYKRAHWLNGDVVIEEGTFSLRQELDIQIMGETEADIHTYTNYIQFTPSSYLPNNCGYSLDMYEENYVYTENGSVETQWVDVGDDNFHQAFGWVWDPDWAEVNLNQECL